MNIMAEHLYCETPDGYQERSAHRIYQIMRQMRLAMPDDANILFRTLRLDEYLKDFPSEPVLAKIFKY